MSQTFTQLGLRPELLSALQDLSHETPTPIQSDIIPLMLDGIPGKNGIQALILTPTRELAIQVANAIDEYGKYINFRSMAIYGGQSYSEQFRNLRNGLDIIVGTPGRLLDLIEKKNALDLSNLCYLVLDEADEMLSMGFVEDIERILQQTPPTRQTALFSATLPQPIRNLAQKYLNDPQSITIKSKELTVDTIEQRYYVVDERNKLAALTRIIEMEDINSALIFARTRASSRELANELVQRNFPTEVLNGDLSQDARMQILDSFRDKKISILVATDVAARGIDIEDISHVFNYDLPDQSEVYVHRIGRTGRAGRSGTAITLVPGSKLYRIKRIEGLTRSPMVEHEIPTKEEIIQRRQKAFEEKIQVWLNRGRCREERAIVDKFVAEGIDPAELAAVMMKMSRTDDNKRPIQELKKARHTTEQRKQTRKRSRSRDRVNNSDENNFSNPPKQNNKYAHDNAGTGRESQEPGMTRLRLNRGRKHGIKPGEIVSSIAHFADIPGNAIGKIVINDKSTFVDVPDQLVSQVLEDDFQLKIHKNDVEIRRA
jgi:ATP-dependent RNA helicase DeaD